MTRSLFEDLSKFTIGSVEMRAENAHAVAVKFFNLLESEAPNDKAYELMVKAWFRAVKSNDFSKFSRTYKKCFKDK